MLYSSARSAVFDVVVAAAVTGMFDGDSQITDCRLDGVDSYK